MSAEFPCRPRARKGRLVAKSRTDSNPVTHEDRMTAIKSLTAALMIGVSGLFLAAPPWPS